MAVINILMVPVFIRYMGVEAYGLVGIYALLQAWFQLLDLGLTPTLIRETARFRGGATDALHIRRLLRVLEWIFYGMGLIGGVLMVCGSNYIALHWLKASRVPPVEVHRAVVLMAGIVTLRWVSGIYRGALTGFERLVWLSWFNIAVTTARFVLVVPVFKLLGTSPTAFFSYQAGLAVIEVVVLILQTYRTLPARPKPPMVAWEWSPLKEVVKFSLSAAFTGSVWVIVTQTDKLVLSKMLTLKNYALYTLAVLAANGLFSLFSPIASAVLPRMTRLMAEHDEEGMIGVYRQATQLVAIACIPAAVVLTIWAPQVLFLWTGDLEIARSVSPVLALYAIGNGFLVLGALPYYLQFAKGNLRLHVIGNAIFLAWLIPVLIWATVRMGFIGAGCAWLASNFLYFSLWVPLVHRRMAKGLHLPWLLRDILPIAAPPVIAGVLLRHFWSSWPQARSALALRVGSVSMLLLLLGIAGSSLVRGRVLRWTCNHQ